MDSLSTSNSQFGFVPDAEDNGNSGNYGFVPDGPPSDRANYGFVPDEPAPSGKPSLTPEADAAAKSAPWYRRAARALTIKDPQWLTDFMKTPALPGIPKEAVEASPDWLKSSESFYNTARNLATPENALLIGATGVADVLQPEAAPWLNAAVLSSLLAPAVKPTAQGLGKVFTGQATPEESGETAANTLLLAAPALHAGVGAATEALYGPEHPALPTGIQATDPYTWRRTYGRPGAPPEPEKPPIQNPNFMLPAPARLSAPSTEPVTGAEPAMDWRAVQERFQSLTNEAQRLGDQLQIFPNNPVLINRIDQINRELSTLGTPAETRFTADVEAPRSPGEVAAAGARARQLGIQSIEQPLGGDSDAIRSSDAQMEAGQAPLGQQVGPGGDLAEAGSGDYGVGEAQRSDARGALRAEAQPGSAGQRPVATEVAPSPDEETGARTASGETGTVEGAPSFQDFQKQFQGKKGWTMERRQDEYQRLYGKYSPENAALLTPDEFSDAANTRPEFQQMLKDSEGGPLQAAYDQLDDAIVKGKPVNADLWDEVMEHPPEDYRQEGNNYVPDIREKRSVSRTTGQPFSLEDETRNAFTRSAEQDPTMAAMSNFYRKNHGTPVEQVSLPDLSTPAGRSVGPRARRAIETVESAAKAYGSNVIWFRGTDRPIEAGQAAYHKGNIYLNVDMAGREPLHEVFSHELAHYIEDRHPDLYTRLTAELGRNFVRKETPGGYLDRLEKSRYPEKQRQHELAADFVGEALRDPVRFQKVMGQKPGLLEQFKQAFNNFVDWSRRKILGHPDIDPRSASALFRNLKQLRDQTVGIVEEARRRAAGGGEEGIQEKAIPRPGMKVGPVGEGGPEAPAETGAAAPAGSFGAEPSEPILEKRLKEPAPDETPEEEFVRRPGMRSRSQILSSDQPWVSTVANRFVEDRMNNGTLGLVIPGEGYSTEALRQRGLGMNPERVASAVSRTMHGGETSLDDAAAIMGEEARLSQRSAEMSRIADRNPRNAEAQRNAEEAFQQLTDFHNGPVRQFKMDWSNKGRLMQGEIPVDLSTSNGMREAFLRDTGKPPTEKEMPTLRRIASKVSDSMDLERGAMKNLSDAIAREVEKSIRAGKPIPSEAQVRSKIMGWLKNEPC